MKPEHSHLITMGAQRELIDAEFELDHALQWGDMVGIRKASARIQELRKAVRQERRELVREQFRGLFNLFKPQRHEPQQ